MKLNNKITSCIWDNCAKQIVEGYVYVKMDDIIKININNEDLIMDDLEITPKIITKEVVVKEEINEDSVANYLVNEGFKYETSVDGKSKFWSKYETNE
jgi:hypothetical protein